MIMWLGLVAKFLNFVAEKTAGRVIDAAADPKRKAVRTLLGFYHCLDDLEALSREILVELRYLRDQVNAELRAEWIAQTALAVDQTSQRFVESTLGLGDALEIFDPVLAATVGDLEAHKFSFLLTASAGFTAEPKKGTPEGIRYTRPAQSLLDVPLDQRYDWYKSNWPLDARGSLDWPDWTTFGLIRGAEDVVKERLRLEDPQSVNALLEVLESHANHLQEARRRLGDLLRSNFTLEDLLAARTPRQQFDRNHVMQRQGDALGVPYTRFFMGKPASRMPRADESAVNKTKLDETGNG